MKIPKRSANEGHSAPAWGCSNSTSWSCPHGLTVLPPRHRSSELLAIAFTVKKQRLLIPYLDVVIESTLPTR